METTGIGGENFQPVVGVAFPLAHEIDLHRQSFEIGRWRCDDAIHRCAIAVDCTVFGGVAVEQTVRIGAGTGIDAVGAIPARPQVLPDDPAVIGFPTVPAALAQQLPRKLGIAA